MKKISILLLVIISFFTLSLNNGDDNTNSTNENEVYTEKLNAELASYSDEDYYNYQYSGPEEIHYLYDIYDTSRIFSKVDNFTYGLDYYGDNISLYDGSSEVYYDKGIASWGNSGSFTIRDVAEYGYEYFETYIGTTISSRTTDTNPSFEVRVVLDGVVAKTVSVTDKYEEQVFIKVPLKGVQNFQLFVDNLGNGVGDFVGLGNPLLRKSSPAPYLDVFDMEFNQPNQVTESNLLEYAKAYDVSGNNISDDVRYITNYIPGKIGVFDLTYYVFDSNGVMRSRDVSLLVTGEDYGGTWTIEDFKKPYVNYMYHARQAYNSNMKKLWDLLIEITLDFDEDDWVKRLRSSPYYTSQNSRDVSFSSANIFVTESEVNSIIRGMHDCEPRSYMMLNLTPIYHNYYGYDSTTGSLSWARFWAQNKTTDSFNEEIKLINYNSERFIAYAKDDMTYAQKWKYVTDAYAGWIKYSDGSMINSSLGYGVGKCNGNSQGLVHLSQRINMKSVYAEGGSSQGFHAWTYNKLPDEDGYYLTDRLFYTFMGSIKDSGYVSSHSVYTNRGYTMYEISLDQYNYTYLTYPSVWINFNTNAISITEGEDIDLYSNISSFGSILNGTPTIDNVEIKVTFGSQKYDVTSTKTLKNGLYKVTYTLEYTCDGITIIRDYEMDLNIVVHTIEFSDIKDGLSNVSLYPGGATNENSNYDSSNEISGKGFGINDGNGYNIFLDDITDNAITFKYGASISARTNSYTMANCRISVSVYIDGVVAYTSNQMTAWTPYIDVFVLIPEGASVIRLVTNAHSSGGCHGTVMDIKFGNAEIPVIFEEVTSESNSSSLVIGLIITLIGLAAGVIGGFMFLKHKGNSEGVVKGESVSSKSTTKKESTVTKSATTKPKSITKK